MRMVKRGLVAVAALILAAGATQAQSVADFYKGKQLQLVIASPTGDIDDLLARLVAKHMVRHIPGNPTIVPVNMPGAGTVVGANHLFNVAAKDGTVFGEFSRNIMTLGLTDSTVKFDPRKFGWLGSPQSVITIGLSLATSGVKTGEDLFTKELIVGGTGGGTTPVILPMVLNKIGRAHV